MSARVAGRAGWGMAALALALMVAGQVFGRSLPGRGSVSIEIVIGLLVIAFSVIGALVVSRQPRNAIGWIFCGVGVASGLGAFSGGYAEYWVSGSGGSESLAATAAWYSNFSWIPFVVVPIIFVPLLFPNGRLLTRRWRWIAGAGALGIALILLGLALKKAPIDDFAQIQNPYGVLGEEAAGALDGLGFLIGLVALVGSPASLILRFRRAEYEQRQQIKWLAAAGAIAATIFAVGIIVYDTVGEDVADASMMVGVLGLPIAAGIAILRHRLYDIDVVINRTLVYGALTAALAGVYLGSVLLLQLALGGLTEDSSLAIAGSTLAVAALFRPARIRIQEGVDRRFYRNRYDARLTLESFSVRLRDEVDLAALDAELRAVIAETMQPAHVSLWLRTPEPR